MTLEERVSKLEGASEQVNGRLSDASARQDQAQSEMHAGFGRIDLPASTRPTANSPRCRPRPTAASTTPTAASTRCRPRPTAASTRQTNRRRPDLAASTNCSAETNAAASTRDQPPQAETNRRFDETNRRIDETRAEIARLTRLAVGLMVVGVAATGLIVTLFQVFA